MGFWIRTAEEKAERGRKKFAAGNKFYNADGRRLTLKEVNSQPKNDRVTLWLAAKHDQEQAAWERTKAERAAKKAAKAERK
jgi:hypothetical protein